MESFLSLFIFHDSYVVSFLVIGITIVVVMLLLFNQKSPETVVKTEMGSNENIEGALRRVLGEQRWAQASETQGALASAESGSAEKLQALENEVLEKDKAIADLNKQLTQSSGGGGDAGNNDDLMNKIAELESRLQEYEIIEDDIADLSLYRAENDKLKAELERLKALAGPGDEASEPEPEVASQVEEDETPVEPSINGVEKEEESGSVDVSPQNEDSTPITIEASDDDKPQTGTDLVAEFEKVVNSQDQLSQGDVEPAATGEEGETGKVLMAEEITTASESSGETEVKVHPKLKNVNPDSKEEAEVFISDLKSLKKAQQE